MCIFNNGLYWATAVIDAKERKDVATFDVPGSFLRAEIKPKNGNYQHVVLRGSYVDIMCEVNPEYVEYVKYVDGKKCYT